MRTVSLFIAMSLDGYIADNKGRVDWLKGQGDDNENMDTYSEFVKNIDTILMGWNTYHQVVTELSPNEWIYRDFTTLGSGIRLFENGKHEVKLRLLNSRSYNGMTDLVYTRR
ncbi:dihydrofolate reductase family protein [Lachnoclostridium sp. An181]|uniref:dihydrofolate reductase family protein n=1 Tax=Lachnoclostridium sp. An181 TaxID=1965575 RepID=UPI000B37880E|nr:dihydrofolate reductase family protein [Lachnoclostridium sp. An181]OUP49494.1 hypothetical protein B5F18_07840 [Lachnoclostridium sp. An181]